MHVYVSKFVSIGLLYCFLAAKNPDFSVFGLRHFVMPTVGGNLRKLNTGAQLQTFPYPTASKSFLYSNAFMVKSGAQTLTFNSLTDRKSVMDRQNNSTFFAAPAAGEIRAHQTWHGDRGTRARSCTSKARSTPATMSKQQATVASIMLLRRCC